MGDLAFITFEKLIEMFVILFVGIIGYKTKIISESGNKTLSNVLLMIINPVVLFMAFQQDYTPQLLKNFIVSVFFAVIAHIVGIIISYIFIKKTAKDFEIEKVACMYSNCGFIGIPIINALFGSEGVFYLAAYLAIFNLFLWTHGLVVTTGKFDIKTIISGLLSPCMIAIFLGAAFAYFRLPEIISAPLNTIADMNTPTAMLIAGATMAQSDLLKAVKNYRIYIVAIAKLFIVPILTAAVLYLFRYDNMVTTITVIEMACPVAASGTMFALRYNRNAIYASELYVITTLLSAISLPMVIIITNYIDSIIYFLFN